MPMISQPTYSLQGMENTRVASLAFLIYEICITLDQEIEFIWTQPNKCWVKWQYLFTRYFALFALIANRSIEMRVTMLTESLPSPLREWFSCQVIIGGALMLSVELVLMTRVYALYKHSSSIVYIFGGLLVCEITSAVVGVVLNYPKTNLDSDVVLQSGPHSFIYFGITAIISQVVVLLLTILKYKTAKSELRKSPIATLVVRDGTIAFTVILFVTAWTLLSAITDLCPPISDSWFLAVVSCAGCRLVINLLQSSSDMIAAEGVLSSVQLTTSPGDISTVFC
ncbi:hypothetical protein P691DRAFT_576176 [Macrolepiota fuliginosa MF-IS2]|uniref:DUF6533 domain-containing protein n=1 Tax=Macrolepiota fuliginosa MF-IS2 TaxID=1400762 RepID=A0A9P5XD20_9AGAR|nr:hypothetical protein P691DRAFT_576176 [Macrolepiota fuliginosa MF-IS2]